MESVDRSLRKVAMPFTAQTWPIAASMLPFTSTLDPRRWDSDVRADWLRALTSVRDAGFDAIDLTDTWLPFGDFTAEQVAGFTAALDETGLSAPSISVIRRSVIDAGRGDEHLAYSHRAIDLAAHLGSGVVSVGLHQELTAEQRRQLWFWTVRGHVDQPDDRDAWNMAVSRFRELGRHAAEVGVLLSLELYEHTYLGSAQSSVRLVEEIGLSEVGLNPDIGNLIRLHEPVESWREVVEATLPYSNFWHVKNYTRDEDPRSGVVSTVPSYLESGLIDYRFAVATAIASGFHGVICTEHYGGDGLSMSAANRDYLRNRVLPRADYELAESRVKQQYSSVMVSGS
jgi:sugar phosphate isomerase/epimerase